MFQISEQNHDTDISTSFRVPEVGGSAVDVLAKVPEEGKTPMDVGVRFFHDPFEDPPVADSDIS